MEKPSKKVRVLICDDEPTVIEVHSLSLRQLFYNLTTDKALSIADAFALLKHTQYDLIICDLNFYEEGLTGLDLLLLLRKSSINIPFILCTTMEPSLLIPKNRNYRFLAKPYKTNELKEAINELLPHCSER